MKRIYPILIIALIIWTVYIVDINMGAVNLIKFGILPRNIQGLKGILLSPFIHASFAHVASNTVPFIVLGSLLFLFYKKEADRFLFMSVLITGSLVWVFGRDSYHVGISGIIYSLASFLVYGGIVKGKIMHILLSIAIVIFYGGMIWGIFPTSYFISWESHLFGTISGVFLASKMIKK